MDPTLLSAKKCIYVIGDIHGRLDLLQKLHKLILRDIKKYPHHQKKMIYLGDLIDRGDESKEVIDTIIKPFKPFEVIALKGNHEDMLLKFLKNPRTAPVWFINGGLQTLTSYDIPITATQKLDFQELRKALEYHLPKKHLLFFQTLKTHYVDENYYFCHAGVNPDYALDKQPEEDLIWIREPFISSTKDFGKIVIHGHTYTAYPVISHNRIGIDTGAVFTNTLTCLVLTDQERYFLHT